MNAKRRPLIAGNWKMHAGGLDGIKLAASVGEVAPEVPHVDLLVAPPFTALAAVSHELEGSSVFVAGQNVHGKPHGAFTGEISATMLREAGATWVIVGHSERRQYFRETDAEVAAKASAALDHDLSPIACVGETLAEREANKTLEVVERQVTALLDVLAGAKIACAIAYEPIWAIGTGKNASPADAEEVHAAIRRWLAAKNAGLAERVRVLYGGSVKPENAKGLLAEPNVDGALVGGASLDAGSFGAIAKAAESLTRS
ncbi:MAG TPA: triose-phosphate isomerase [Polyangiaceae bacterium]|jgi:triosephosphate isomerase